MKSFFGEWRTMNNPQIWQITAFKFGLNFVGVIEQQQLLPNSVRQQLFAWQTKFGEIDHLNQHFTITQIYKFIFTKTNY